MITSRIYDTDGGPDWSGVPSPRESESLSDYAYRLQRWARSQILAASDSYGDADHVRGVDYPHEAHVVVRAEDDSEEVEYYLCATVEGTGDPTAGERAEDDYPHEANVVVRAEDDSEEVEYYLCATVEGTGEPTAGEGDI